MKNTLKSLLMLINIFFMNILLNYPTQMTREKYPPCTTLFPVA